MDINKVLLEYDNMYGVNSLEEIDEFLTSKIEQALDEEDFYSALTLMNEMLGFCRDTSQREKGLRYCAEVENMFDRMGLHDTLEYATSLINVANVYRAFGFYDKAMDAFRTVELIYKAKLPVGEFNYASLYNNWSLLYQEIGDFKSAYNMLKRALSVVDMYERAVIQQATTRCNLAATLLHMSREASEDNTEDGVISEQYYDEAIKYLKESLDIFEADGGRDFHYGAALSAMGDALYLKEKYDEASTYYKRALDEIEKHIGKNDSYDRVYANYKQACEAADKKNSADDIADNDTIANDITDNNLERCRRFYEQYGAPMIHEKFPEYEERIAVGMAGEGSDCFGYEDDISKDHDYGIGFCLWLTSDDYERIGISLNKEYEKLINKHAKEYKEHAYNRFFDNRRGVATIGRFYENTLGVRLDENTEKRGGIKAAFDSGIWLTIAEDKLATATNGRVFRDDLGIFSSIRNELLMYYPDEIWRLRLARALHDFSQYAQSNYARMMARKDYVTSAMCVSKGIESVMEIAYLLNRTYAPYYKWMYHGLKDLCVLKGIIPLIDKLAVMKNQADAWDGNEYSPYDINHDDQIVCTFEQIAVLILEELRLQGLTSGNDTFMDIHSQAIMGNYVSMDYNDSDDVDNNMDDGDVEGSDNEMDSDIKMNNQELVDKVVELEWKQFDRVKNEGGRADCQDDWNTFSIMRKSQYMAWDESLLTSYYNDIVEAENRGWNMIMEKYARMMASTAPDEYAKLKDKLPERSEERNNIAEAIIKIQVSWMEEFAKEYPKMAGNARSIHTSEDSAYNTSYETYLRGELGTYSEQTIGLYSAFIVSLYKAGKNLAYMIMDNTAKLYGYKDVQDAEKRLN